MPKPRRVDPRFKGRNDYLKRLPADHYRGQAFVHWSMTVDKRRTGWLSETVYHRFREVLTHALFRYSVCCPIYCCMPDHLHLLWVGIAGRSDQRLAARFFRTQWNVVLESLDVRLQDQPYDHVCA
ncbi:MAG TPA: hypothetical protein VG125_21915 [Pirellulales bacterium]|jgi:putative transposase|nr:hypothetical protein [Pirellulales bacterium]